MQRVLVMGSSGSGKSTFARRLSAMTGIPTVSIDALFWKAGWVESGRDEFERRMSEAAREPRWIMDGNYMRHGAGELRRELSDTIIWFDLPRSTCMLGIFRRIAASYGQVRPEMADGCPEKIDLEFFRYVWTYRQQQRPKLIEYLAGLRPDQSLVCFTDRAQEDDYLTRLALGQNRASIH
ncbi:MULTISPECIES: DNA topology modulation protein [Bradyrhizobium]|uniref:DNA topology modulation protein n=1 Tax=Bradyrhizobium elkanii TaxID=29448 RepID=A0A4U6RT21_BRAEL|nr:MULTISPECIES: DNA topology modulation protein [Bradyrhizobium]MTV13123.1 DNA topology modulation protein [Bradyrhizobium sp. BR2003]TKV78064.1 DNA topology modulation protein [Bradyrhizobium elkanii]